jgi:tetratricopeptide (TPR) repeat protein
MSKVLMSAFLAIAVSSSFATPEAVAQRLSQDQTAAATYKGIEAIKARQFSIAISEFTKLSNSEPGNGEYLALRGSAYYDSKDYARAKTDFENAIRKGYTKHVTFEQLNNAESRIIAGSKVAGSGTVGETVEKASNALKSGDYPTAIGSSTALIEDIKLPAKVHQGGYIIRAETFIKMGRKQNAKIDAETVINSGLDVPQTRDLLKRATQ